MLTRRNLLKAIGAGTLLLATPSLAGEEHPKLPVEQVRIQRPSEPPKIIIFAGHTTLPEKQGALSCTEIPEYQYNDAILPFLPKDDGLEYLLIPASENIPLKKRPKLAQRLGAELYLEIHHDSIPQEHLDHLRTLAAEDPLWQEVRGFSLHYTEGKLFSPQSLALAQALGDQLKEFLVPDFYHQKHQRMELLDPERAIYQRNLYVTRFALMPAVLVECGYIINPPEEAKLSREETRKQIALALHQGVKKYIG